MKVNIKVKIWLCLFILIFPLTAGCAKRTGDTDDGRIRVVSTIFASYDFARQIAQTFQIDSIWQDDITDEDLKEKLAEIPVDESVNAILTIPYSFLRKVYFISDINYIT